MTRPNTQFDNTNRGVLFNNDRKQTDNHPDMTGTLNINGVEHWFSAWWKNSPQKGDFLSLSIGNVKEQRQQAPQQPQRRGPQPARSPGQQARHNQQRQSTSRDGFDDMDDDIPY